MGRKPRRWVQILPRKHLHRLYQVQSDLSVITSETNTVVPTADILLTRFGIPQMERTLTLEDDDGKGSRRRRFPTLARPLGSKLLLLLTTIALETECLL